MSDLNYEQIHLCSQFGELKLMLSYCFRCDQIYGNNCYESGHPLSPTKMFNIPTTEVGLLNIYVRF
jgi:hypothetical protein